MHQYFEPISNKEVKQVNPIDENKYEPKTPKRITVRYQTTGYFKDISKEKETEYKKSVSG